MGASCARAQPVLSNVPMHASRNYASSSSQWPNLLNAVHGLAYSPKELYEPWTFGGRPALAAVAAVNSPAAILAFPALSVPQHDPEALLLGLLRVCAATTPAMASPSNSPGPQDPHSLLQRLIHAEAAAAALRQQADAQVRGWRL